MHVDFVDIIVVVCVADCKMSPCLPVVYRKILIQYINVCTTSVTEGEVARVKLVLAPQ